MAGRPRRRERMKRNPAPLVDALLWDVRWACVWVTPIFNWKGGGKLDMFANTRHLRALRLAARDVFAADGRLAWCRTFKASSRADMVPVAQSAGENIVRLWGPNAFPSIGAAKQYLDENCFFWYETMEGPSVDEQLRHDLGLIP